MRFLSLCAGLALLATACGRVPEEADAGNAPSGPPLAITTESIASGRSGVAYSQPMAATGGLPPYGWSLGAKSAEVAWLRIDPVSGALSGTPDKAAAGASVTVVVTDQRAATATRDFTLSVESCRAGDTLACHAGSSTGCVVGTLTCVDGAFPADCSGVPSTSKEQCGPDCAACGANADRCTDGACACGTGAPCGAGQLCCAGACVDGNDPKTCGGCGNDCTAQAGANVAASCTSGQCSFACQPEFLNCAPGSSVQTGCPVHIADDLQNCGACNHACSTDLATADAPTCTEGVCTISCHPDRLDCDKSPENGCEVARSPSDCTGCGAACHPAGTDNVAAPGCSPAGGYHCAPSCNAGYENCDGQDSNGCEINLTNDLNHCGSCSKVCTTVGGASVGCVNGACKVTACTNGALDCDGDPANGCEVAANPCGCGCAGNQYCSPTGCKLCKVCGGESCCTTTCQYCASTGNVECGPCF